MFCPALKNMGRCWYNVCRKNGKEGNRGTHKIFISYAKNYTRACNFMLNPNTEYVTETRDIMWLHCMYYSKPEARNEVMVYIQIALSFELEDTAMREDVKLNASEPQFKSKDDEKEWSTVHVRLIRIVKSLVLYMKECGSDRVEGMLSTIHQN